MHAPLFTAPVLLVEQPRRLFAAEGHYEVLSEDGHPLAYVNEHMTAWSHSHRQGSQRPHRFTIYGPEGHPLLTLDKPWDRGRPYIYVTGPHGEPYGSIVQDRSFAGSRFRLNDPRGHTIAEIRGDWNGWDFTVLDHSGIEIARIGKEHPGLTSGFFTTEDRYALEFAYDLPWPLRRLVIGAAITVDVLLHEREPEFYHSHYADFQRYPEYGYEPRHHWHHPRRGYVVTRRRRPPLVVHSFQPVRRRGYVPMRERAASPRGGYRTFSSRSVAPSRRSQASQPRGAARTERRGGAGFASRSQAPARRGGGFDSRSEAAARSSRPARSSRSETPSSGAAARRERQARQSGAAQSRSGDRARGVFGGGAKGSASTTGSRSSRSTGGASGSSARSSGRSASRSAGASPARRSSSRSSGASRGSGGFRSAGGAAARSGRSSRSSGSGRSGRGRSGGSSRRR